MMLSKEDFKIASKLLTWTMILLALSLSVTGAVLFARPAFLDLTRTANTHSQEFVAGRLAEINNDVATCTTINTQIAILQGQGGHATVIAGLQGQRRAIQARIQHAKQDLPNDVRLPNLDACN